jgi:hypothetical protein
MLSTVLMKQTRTKKPPTCVLLLPQGSATLKAPVQQHVHVPGRGMVSVQQLVAEFNHLAPGEKPSKDRLTRVAQLCTEPGGTERCRSIMQVSCGRCVSVHGCSAYLPSTSLTSSSSVQGFTWIACVHVLSLMCTSVCTSSHFKILLQLLSE